MQIMQAKVGVAKTQLYLRATLRNNFIKFSSLSCLSLRDLAVHTDRQMYKLMPIYNTLLVLPAQHNPKNSPNSKPAKRETHNILNNFRWSSDSLAILLIFRP